jgi:hypothetical protein
MKSGKAGAPGGRSNFAVNVPVPLAGLIADDSFFVGTVLVDMLASILLKVSRDNLGASHFMIRQDSYSVYYQNLQVIVPMKGIPTGGQK